MLDALELTPRQANRLLEEAIRSSARVEIEPRSFSDGCALRGALKSREGSMLSVELQDAPRDLQPISLMGAFCEVRSTLSGQIFVFTTCVLDVVETLGPARLSLAVPDVVQVTNRRRYERTNATVASEVSLIVGDDELPAVGVLANISPDGLACAFAIADLSDRVLVGEPLRVRFEIAGFDDSFELPALVCSKSATPNRAHVLLGLEFDNAKLKPRDAAVLKRVRATLEQMLTESTRMEGGE